MQKKNDKIILLNIDDGDPCISLVIDWLNYFGAKFKIIRGREEILEFKNCKINNEQTNFAIEEIIDSSSIKSYWCRRGQLSIIPLKSLLNSSVNSNPAEQKKYLYSYLGQEFENITEFIRFQYDSKKEINCESDNNTNKLINLQCAKNVGLKIPSTIVTSYKSDLESFMTIYSNVITKSINIGAYTSNNTKYYSSTKLVFKDDLINVKQTFLPSLFQEYVEKLFEIRIFYLKATIISMAIFSQNDPETKIDYRNYNFTRNNRMPPFVLPTNIEQKIISLMKNLNLESGSIDMIYTPLKEFYFLEVNTVGIFDNVSKLTNSYIEKIIAQNLVNRN